MANILTIRIEETVLRWSELNEVLRCLLHTILFVRGLGPVSPVTVDSDVAVSYVHCGDARAAKVIEAGILTFSRYLQEGGLVKGAISLSFFEERLVPTWWFGSEMKNVIFEQWQLPVEIADQVGIDNDELEDLAAILREAVSQRIVQILERVGTDIHYFPEPQNNGPVSWLFSVGNHRQCV